MRLKVECELRENKVTTFYNQKILSFFKHSLEFYSKEIKDFYYSEAKEKDMSFACYFSLEKISNNEIYLKDNIFKIFITFNSITDGLHYYNSFINSKHKKIKFKLGNNEFCIKNIVKLQEKKIDDDVAIFQTLSPIVIREKTKDKKDFFHILDENGIKILYKNIKFLLEKNFSKETLEKIEIIPIKTKKTIVSFYGIKFPTTKGIFAIKGDKNILEYFYKAGLGSKKSSGFGMLEIISK